MDKRFDVVNRIFIDEQGFLRYPVEQKEYCVRNLDKIIVLLPDYIEEKLTFHPNSSVHLEIMSIMSLLLSGTESIVNGDKRDHIINEIRKKVPMSCPEKGEFIGYKKIIVICFGKFGKGDIKYWIAKLRIPETAQRSSAFGSKCRCSEAFVEEITSIGNDKSYTSGLSPKSYNVVLDKFEQKYMSTYTVGEYVKPDSFDPDWWNECSNGIHFFMTREEAENYIP